MTARSAAPARFRRRLAVVLAASACLASTDSPLALANDDLSAPEHLVRRASTDASLPADIDRMKTPRNNASKAETLVRENYTTRPVKTLLDGQEFWIPMNYMTPFGDKPDEMRPKFVQFFVFLPDFIGYTPDNFRDRMSKDKISVALGKQFGFSPERKFENGQARELIGKESSHSEFGLTVYPTNVHGKSVMVGKRSNGRFLMLDCTDYSARGVVRPSCSVEYPDAEQGYGLFYSFHRDQLQKWKQIDERINSLILSWRKK